MAKIILLLAVIGLAVIVSGCTGGQDITPIVKTLPEVQQFLKEHPNAKITVTYWSKEDVGKIADEISQQCDKPITPAAMYKAVISEGELKSIAWIDAATQKLICSATEGKGITPTPTQTATYTPVVTTPVITQTSTPTPTPTPTPTSTPTATPTSTTPAPTPTSISLPSSKTMTAGETWDLGNGYTLTTQGIDAFVAPSLVLIVFRKDGIKLHEGMLTQGFTYTYGKIFSTKIASIYPIKNPEGSSGVGASAVRFENSTLTPTSTSLPSIKGWRDIKAGETWNLGNGYTLTIQSIGAKAWLKKAVIVFSKDGIKLDEKTLTEGYTYTYGNIFSTEIAEINAEVSVRLDNSTFLS